MPGFDISNVDVTEREQEIVKVKAELALDPEAKQTAVASGVLTIRDEETEESVDVENLVLLNE